MAGRVIGGNPSQELPQAGMRSHGAKWKGATVSGFVPAGQTLAGLFVEMAGGAAGGRDVWMVTVCGVQMFSGRRAFGASRSSDGGSSVGSEGDIGCKP